MIGCTELIVSPVGGSELADMLAEWRRDAAPDALQPEVTLRPEVATASTHLPRFGLPSPRPKAKRLSKNFCRPAFDAIKALLEWSGRRMSGGQIKMDLYAAGAEWDPRTIEGTLAAAVKAGHLVHDRRLGGYGLPPAGDVLEGTNQQGSRP